MDEKKSMFNTCLACYGCKDHWLYVIISLSWLLGVVGNPTNGCSHTLAICLANYLLHIPIQVRTSTPCTCDSSFDFVFVLLNVIMGGLLHANGIELVKEFGPISI
jgi:hypothetical protein